MHGKLHLFNPENDLALALGCRHYTPPPHAAALHRAGALLPAWWAGEDDAILVTGDYSAEAESLLHKWGLRCTPIEEAPSDLVPQPWGWSLDAKRQFLNAGVAPQLLPTDETIKRLRMLSHRRSSITILKALDRPDLLPKEVTDADRAVEMEMTHPGSFFKAPWSCSGRGVFCAGGIAPEVVRSKAAGIIHRQGSVMVEQGRDKVTDLAALFHSDGKGIVEFRGLSMFITEARGVYSGNIVAPQSALRTMLEPTGMMHEIDSTCERLQPVLASLIGGIYAGWLGIDMMVYRDDNGHNRLHPCIELNLRTTMGLTAMAIAKRAVITTPHLVSWQLAPNNTFTLQLSKL